MRSTDQRKRHRGTSRAYAATAAEPAPVKSASATAETARCNLAKSKHEGSLREAGAKLRSGLEDLKSLGKAGPAQIISALDVSVPETGRPSGLARSIACTTIRKHRGGPQ